jgi:hypothetical protein
MYRYGDVQVRLCTGMVMLCTGIRFIITCRCKAGGDSQVQLHATRVTMRQVGTETDQTGPPLRYMAAGRDARDHIMSTVVPAVCM